MMFLLSSLLSAFLVLASKFYHNLHFLSNQALYQTRAKGQSRIASCVMRIAQYDIREIAC